MRRAMSRPTRMPPPTSQVSRMKPCATVGVSPRTTMATPNSRARRPVASLTRLSPSRMSTMRWEAEIFRNGGGGDGVGGGDDGAEDDAKAKIEWGEGIICGFGDSPDGEADKAKGEKEDA